MRAALSSRAVTTAHERPDDPLLEGLAPVVGRRPRVLVLGSMPSEASLRQAQYYGHPRNAFWAIQGALFGFDPGLPYAERLAALRAAGVALWDVIGRCRRRGSLDSAIRDVEPNDIAGLLAAHPTIRAVCLNGGKAAELFARHVLRATPELFVHRTIHRLPSTSPAHAARDFDAKLAAWGAVAAASSGDSPLESAPARRSRPRPAR
ncbi:MAG: DNA-deoxyinosine glycosylase [Planctomycetes bacterium]|nr:DNA-deoxyinosine glycosylase [Planctomycetota bacterium]